MTGPSVEQKVERDGWAIRVVAGDQKGGNSAEVTIHDVERIARQPIVEEPIGEFHTGCLHCGSRPEALPLESYPHPGFGMLDLTCDGESPEWFGAFMDWGYWKYADGSHATINHTGLLGWRASWRDDMHWETQGERVQLRDIEEAVALDSDHDWRLHVHGPMYGVVYQRQGCGRWVAVEKLEGFA